MRGGHTPQAERPLTARQREVVEAIRRLTAEKGYAPSLRELRDAIGISSTTGVLDHLRALVAKGAVAYSPQTARSLRVLHPQEHAAP